MFMVILSKIVDIMDLNLISRQYFNLHNFYLQKIERLKVPSFSYVLVRILQISFSTFHHESTYSDITSQSPVAFPKSVVLFFFFFQFFHLLFKTHPTFGKLYITCSSHNSLNETEQFVKMIFLRSERNVHLSMHSSFARKASFLIKLGLYVVHYKMSPEIM